MCGINGIINMKNAEDMIRRMNKRLEHRGPDAEGVTVSDDGMVTMGHRRLSILDLSEKGAQPMRSRSERYMMVYNGEIYNHMALRDKLLLDRRVEGFRGTSDTEILIESFEAWGIPETLSFCRGMWAIALYDQEEKLLYLTRDRIGEKPLYFGFSGESFVFSSELNAFKEVDGFEPDINADVLSLYFLHGYIPAPYTVYKDVYKLMPGTVLTIKLPFTKFDPLSFPMEEEHFAYTYYYSIRERALNGQKHPFTGSIEEAEQELVRRLKKALNGQMIADVPIGAFLSAGIDSPTIVSLMQEESSSPVRTFTVGMEDAEYNEADIASEIAAHLGTEHTNMTLTEREAKDVLPLLPDMFSEPFGDSSAIPTYLVSKLTRQHVTVSLSGDAGDELFSGYNTYRSVERIFRKAERLPASLRSKTSAFLLNTPYGRKGVGHDKSILLTASSPLDVILLQLAALRPHVMELVKASSSESVQSAVSGHEQNRSSSMLPRDIIAYRDSLPPHALTTLPPDTLESVTALLSLYDLLLYHPDDILVKVDRAAMAVSLETRIPFLDRDVIDLAFSLPSSYLTDGKNGKLILRNILYKRVPRKLVDRPKKGFSIPVRSWIRDDGALRDWALDLLSDKALRDDGYISYEAASAIRDDFFKDGIWIPQVWYLLMYMAWRG